jgi:hypothetical protein
MMAASRRRIRGGKSLTPRTYLKWTKKRGAAQMGCWLGRRGSGYNRFWTGKSGGKSGVLQPIMPLDSPVKVRPWELTVYPRSHIRR